MNDGAPGQKPETLRDADHADTFDWWWRSIFEAMEPSQSIAELLAPVVEETKHLWWVDVTSPENLASEPTSARPLRDADLNLAARFYGILNKHRERSAFLYEIGKRVTGQYEFGKSWIELPEARKAELEKRWPDPTERIVCKHVDSDETPPTGFGCLPDLWWNLNLNDGTLANEFIKLIQVERTRIGIPNPRPNKGRRLKPLSWRPVEFMDIELHKLRQLNDSERSAVSKVEDLYRASI